MAHLFVGPDASATGSAEFFDINDLLASSFQHNQQQPRDQEDPSDPDSGPCWGALLTGGNVCTPGFKIGRLHFKNKYCDNCRESIMVPLSQVRALTAEQTQHASNRRSEGFWNVAPANMGGGLYRIVNNTATCTGPWLAIFRDAPPDLEWSPIQTNWIVDGALRLCVAKGTLVPAATLRSGHPQSSSKRRKMDARGELYPHPRLSNDPHNPYSHDLPYAHDARLGDGGHLSAHVNVNAHMTSPLTNPLAAPLLATPLLAYAQPSWPLVS